MIGLAQGKKWAERIVGELRPYCVQIAVAGSIRRERPEVGDIDLVMEPRGPAAQGEIRARCLRNASQIVSDGPMNLEIQLPVVRLDIFFARGKERDLLEPRGWPGNWGTLWLCRTGSREFNIWLCERALGRGMRWNPYVGLLKGEQVVASETEEEIFAGLGLRFVEPREREIPAAAGSREDWEAGGAEGIVDHR